MTDPDTIAMIAATLAGQSFEPTGDEDKQRKRARYYVGEAIRFHREARSQLAKVRRSHNTPPHKPAESVVSAEEARAYFGSFDFE